MPETYLLYSVFGGENPESGEKHAVILDPDELLDNEQRQAVATKLSLNESIFIDDIKSGAISIFDTTHQLPFAGTAALVAASLLRKYNPNLSVIVSMDTTFKVHFEKELFWVEARKVNLPGWNIVEATSLDELNDVDVNEFTQYKHTLLWTWISEKAGTVRARTFASDWGIPEVNGNGSGSMKLALQLNRSIELTHGPGNGIKIFASPVEDNPEYAKLGGNVSFIEELAIPLA